MSDNPTNPEKKFDPTETIHVEPPSMRERLEAIRRARAKEARSSTSIPHLRTVTQSVGSDVDLTKPAVTDED